ncbi:MAG TPA: hypothetical protein VHE35_14060 [Kofleriaceae bacterium]|nr:hypothetical protein [Kofleriaceae bacterium]
MKHTVTFTSLLVVALAACGGKSKPAVANGGGGGAGVLAVGTHACHFVVNGEAYGEHRCDVVAGAPIQLQKLSGMETFNGTLTASGGNLQLAGEMGCGDMVAKCQQAFTVDLKRDGAGWSGTVTPKGGADASAGAGAGDWWLSGATFEVDDAAGYGGEPYGSAWPQPDGE